MNDIAERKDIEKLVNEFYRQVVADDVLSHIFIKVAGFDWDTHIPVMYNFWETILLGRQAYKGNAMVKHILLNQLTPLQPQHFNRWLSLWRATVANNFSGQKADEAISRAESIAAVMQVKVTGKIPTI